MWFLCGGSGVKITFDKIENISGPEIRIILRPTEPTETAVVLIAAMVSSMFSMVFQK
jgi:hypothetical protein